MFQSLSIKAQAIANELENRPPWQNAAKWAKNIAVIVLAGLPFPGLGSVAELVDKVGDGLLEPKVEKMLRELADIVLALAPDLERAKEVEAQLGGLVALFRENPALSKKLDTIIATLDKSLPKQFQVRTYGSVQQFMDVLIRDMNVRIEAYAGGQNRLYRFRSSGGDVLFLATGGSLQWVEESEFRGQQGGSVSMDNLMLSGPIATFDDQRGTGIALGPRGRIGFRRRGRLGFGGKRMKSKDEDESNEA